MKPRPTICAVLPGLVAVALLVAACQDSSRPFAPPHKPSFWAGGEQQCPIGKFTGGGRIDPTPPNTMYGKVTFGFNIFLDQHCNVLKGQLEVVHHPSQTKFHSVSFSSASEEGTCVTFFGTVRAKHANGDWHEHSFGVRACDNGEPGSSPGTGPDTFRFAITDDQSFGHGDTGDTPLTGGNIQAH